MKGLKASAENANFFGKEVAKAWSLSNEGQ